MSTMTLQELAKAMGRIDFAMLTTRTDGGKLATRPMSNNGDVEYDGDSFYFSWDSARTVSDIAGDPQVVLSFQGERRSAGKTPAVCRGGGQGASSVIKLFSPSIGRPIWIAGFRKASRPKSW